MIKIKNLRKIYKTEGMQLEALSNINLDIKAGEFVIILGQSGCGKSTLLNILGGMDRPTSGEIEVNSIPLAKKKPDQLAKYRREEIGMIFQKFNLINDASVLENAKLPLKFSGKSNQEQNQIAKSALEQVGLTDKINSLPKKLSGGQQQRVAIARALVNNPQILLCDEPTGNLDSKTGEEIIELIKSLNRDGKTVIMVTHNEVYSKFADRVVKMLDGKIISNIAKPKTVVTEQKQNTESRTIKFLAKLSLAIKNLRRRKLRFFLTSFGISIGAMAIIILVSFGAGLQKDVEEQMQAISQVEEITVTGEKIESFNFSVGADFSKKASKNLNDSTIDQLKKIENVAGVYAKPNLNGEMQYNDKTSIVYGSGLEPIEFIKQPTKDNVAYGEFPQKDDENSVVIPYGQAIALGFSDPAEAIGKEVKIKAYPSNIEFTTKIVGVLAKDDKFSYQTMIPATTASNWYHQIKSEEFAKSDANTYNSLTVRAKEASFVGDIEKAIDELGYGATSYDDIAKQVSRIFTIMQMVLGIVGSIALLVASLGIINTMIMSVLERTKEIGVMKAVGARGKDIQSIFLYEATLIGFFGGIIGLGMGYLGSNAAESIANAYLSNRTNGGEGLSFYVPSYLSIGVMVFSVVVASIAGYFPARRAALLDPAEALREE